MNSLVKISAYLLFVFSLAVITTPSAMAFEYDTFPESDPVPGEISPGFSVSAWLVSIFRDHISAVDADRCPSVPSCSSYSVQAFKKHGFFIGWMMTVDRLIHEGKEEESVSPLIYSERKWKIFDPVENNDFWWQPRDRTGHE